jgi:nucleoside-diphosphate-sugar epimerase
MACRHGLAADPQQARELLADCDLIANFALGSGSPREAHDANLRLIRNSIECSSPEARILYFSTVSVYGDPRPEARIRWKSAYAREKLRCEQATLRVGQRMGREVYVLRLGHVCGELQNVTALIREEIASGLCGLPDPQRASNTVYTATIVDAILRIARGLEVPGTFDLLNQPQWTWRQVFQYEARRVGLPLEEAGCGEAHAAAGGLNYRSGAPRNGQSFVKRALRSAIGLLTASPARKELAMQAIAWLSPRLNNRIQGAYYMHRAAAEIAALHVREVRNDAMRWREVGWRMLKSVAPTAELLADRRYAIPPCAPQRDWPVDIPKAAESPNQRPARVNAR